ncbi:hypothetical protein CsSME_00017512 [Camellia sinensis var. sinensis]
MFASQILLQYLSILKSLKHHSNASQNSFFPTTFKPSSRTTLKLRAILYENSLFKHYFTKSILSVKFVRLLHQCLLIKSSCSTFLFQNP